MEFIPYSPTTLSCFRLPYYVAKASMKIMHSLGIVHATEETSTKKISEVIKEPLTAEIKASYLKIASD